MMTVLSDGERTSLHVGDSVGEGVQVIGQGEVGVQEGVVDIVGIDIGVLEQSVPVDVEALVAELHVILSKDILATASQGKRQEVKLMLKPLFSI